MPKQQHQNPAQGTSSTNTPRDGGQSQGEPVDDTMDTGHRAGHTSSTDSMYGTHSSLGGADERGERAKAQSPAQSTNRSHDRSQVQSQDQSTAGPSSADAPAQGPSKRRATQPTRGGAQGGLTGSIGQLEPGKSNPPKREHAQADDTRDESSRVRPGEAQGQSKYSPTAGEQDKLSRAQGGAPLKDSVLKDAPSNADAKNDASPQSNQRAARPRARNPREGGHGAGNDDSPSVRSPANPGGKLTATHDIDLAGPDNSATKRDK